VNPLLQKLPGRPIAGMMTLLILMLLLLIDARLSVPINPYAAPAPAAWGSGEAPQGAHCTQF
jgi:hypothetical protein